ncbi:unnamed protein product, partial [Adineta steineri]
SFYLYAKLSNKRIDNQRILSSFENIYFLKRNLSFGMHHGYFYTLPFYFLNLHDFPQDFRQIQSNNSK